MKYRESHIDRNLRKWFENDKSCALLKEIGLREGNMRGLTPFTLSLDFPITAISGKNGSGKSTLLAMACCAFHNRRDGFALANRKQTYYTFADFFIQHSEDVPASGILIDYKIAHNRWRKSEHCPDGIGELYQNRKKKRGGKWNDYAGRVSRNVVFMGIDRIVPHVEKSQSKSYSRSFTHTGDKGWEDAVKDIVGSILGKEYEAFKYVSYSKYRLPIVTVGGSKYSGFHMGAGENALFELFSIMFSVPEGSLIVVDEIELGLHSEAQSKLLSHLKAVCKKRKLQIICTTHSREVFAELPDDARVFVENVNGKSVISKGISPEFAFSKMSNNHEVELCVLVEDDVAKCLLKSVLPSNVRSRISIEIIGSSSALSRQLASTFIREKKDNILVVYDGDQRQLEANNLKHAHQMSETNDEGAFWDWAVDAVGYLPGDTWPEHWIVNTALSDPGALSLMLGATPDEIVEIGKQGLLAGKHNEFYEIARLLGLSREDALNRFCIHVGQHSTNEFIELRDRILNRLS